MPKSDAKKFHRPIFHGAKSPLHSGHYGNYAPNPAQRLASLLASMKDDDGRVTIPGYYDRVKITDDDRAIMAQVDDDEPALVKRLGIAHPEKVGANYQEALQYPSLNVRGMASALSAAQRSLATSPQISPQSSDCQSNLT